MSSTSFARSESFVSEADAFEQANALAAQTTVELPSEIEQSFMQYALSIILGRTVSSRYTVESYSQCRNSVWCPIKHIASVLALSAKSLENSEYLLRFPYICVHCLCVVHYRGGRDTWAEWQIPFNNTCRASCSVHLLTPCTALGALPFLLSSRPSFIGC